MAGRSALILVLGAVAGAFGCVAVRQTRLADGSANPADRLHRLMTERRIALHQSSLADTVDALRAPPGGGGGGGVARPSDPEGVRWYANAAARRLSLAWEETVRYYGITLNQHVFYLPVPIWGARRDDAASLTLSFDEHDRLAGWSRRPDPDFRTGYRSVDPSDAAVMFGTGQAASPAAAEP
ncbi:MAG: hypothetical protein JWO31_860 [Phycisphaerales bacterium]|nr:hypothetical protein [Phycisphaerales bacterium]